MRSRLLLCALVAGALVVLPAQAATRPQPVLHLGSHGRRVAALQWLLGGHRPNVFTQVKGTYPYKPNGLFGARTAASVKAYKFRLGYPLRYVKPVAGPYFFGLMLGNVKRPPLFVAIAARRVRAALVVQPTKIAITIKLRELHELGVTESPLGSNRGFRVSQYQSVTGAYGAAWCVSFQQAMFKWSGYGTFANDTASVYYAADYYAARNMLHARPSVGSLVLFVDYNSWGGRIPGTGHMGYVVRVGAGWYVSTEGNEANGVHEMFHHLGDRGNVFANLPGVVR